jgi:hypothetical protein
MCWNSDDRQPVRDVPVHDSASTDTDVGTDDPTGQNDCAESDVTSIADVHSTAERSIRRDVREFSNDAVVLDDCRAVHDASAPDRRITVDHRPGHYHGPGAEAGARCDDRTPMNDHRQLQTFGNDASSASRTSDVVPNRERHRNVPMRAAFAEERAPRDDMDSRYAVPRRVIVDERDDVVRRGVRDIGHHLAVAPRAEDD